MIKYCKECGQPFEGVGTAAYCNNVHYRRCIVCQSSFIWNYKHPKQCCSKKCAAQLRKQTIAKTLKKCELCGKLFAPRSSMQRYCDNKHFNPCPICGTPVEIKLEYDPIRCCSQACSNKLREQTCLAKYGVKVASQASSVRQLLHDKAISNEPAKIKTIQMKYGTKYTNIAQVPEVRDKIRDTVTSSACIAQTMQTNISRTGYPYAMQCPELRAKQSRNSKNLSKLESRLHSILQEFNIDCVEHHVLTDGTCSHEFDVYLPKYKMLIDCDGIYWHSYISDPGGEKVRDDYDDVRVSLVPDDHIFVLLIESDFESGLSNLIYMLKQIDNNLFDYDSHIFSWCRSVEFPYPNYTDDRLYYDYAHLCDYTSTSYNPYCKLGISVIRKFHPSIYHCKVDGHVSPYEAWQSDELLKKCIANRLIYQNDVDPSKVLSGFNISKIAPKVSVFNPILAKYLTLKYLNDFDCICDPFSGFSGRLLGVCSTGKQYVGRDLNSTAVSESHEILKFFSLTNASVTVENILDSYYEYSCLLTCPPYNKKEIYNNETEFHTCDEWIDIVLEHYKCKRYVFVVDKTEKYKDNVVEELKSKSHFRKSSEYVVVIDRPDEFRV